jgi:hypothetical protein
MMQTRTFLLAAACLLPPLPALGAGGVLEINQTCAVETGCFAGDLAGYPITIGASGSYQLTGNLTLPGENTTGIEVQAPYVDLDLGGFAIQGPTTCATTGDPPRTACSPVGVGFGIIIAEPNSGCHIHDGAVAACP